MIIGISGTLFSGKHALADHLQDKFGMLHVSTGDIVREIAQNQKGSVERPVLYEVANELRHKYGGSVLVERALDRYHNSIRTYPGVIITGLRSIAEAQAIKNLGGTLVYVDAPIEIRYERMRLLERDGEARISLEAFKGREAKELSSGISDADFNVAKIGEMADIRLTNTDDIQYFFTTAEKALSLA